MKKSIFIQLSQENETTVRYFTIGMYDKENKFSGMVYGYEGGGEYSDAFVYKNKFLPFKNNSEYLEWEEHVELMDNLVSENIFEILDDEIRNYIDFDTERLSWYVLDDKMKLFEDKVFSLNMKSNPLSYGLNSWENTTTEAWEIEDINKELKEKSKERLFECNVAFSKYKLILWQGFEKIFNKIKNSSLASN